MHFIRRDGPRIFLDTRDLIGVLEKGAPVSVAELTRLLSKVSGRLVLVYTNVAELVPQTENKKADRSHVRFLMRELERLPLSYIRSQEISRHEFRAAIDGFEDSTSVRQVNPYVNQWWQVMWQIPPENMRFIAPDKDAALKRMSLTEMIDHLVSENPEALRFGENDRESLAESVEDDRQRLGTSRGSSASFRAGVKSLFIRFGWPEPKGGIDAFSEFVRADTRICPGWRISHDVYEEYRCNLTGRVTKSDIPDFSHVTVLPYVTHATLDRAWRTRCAQARGRAQKAGLWTAPYDRIFADLSAVLSSLGLAA
jgi:hypothetical protein